MGKVSERLIFAMDSANMTQSELVKLTGINKGALSSYISGRYEPKQKAIYEMAKALKVNEAWLMGYDVPMRRKKINSTDDMESDDVGNIPLYSCISCGTGIFVDDSVEDYVAIPNKYMKRGKEYFANTAKGDSMIGKGIKNGDILVFEKAKVLDNGEIGCFCINEYNEAVCKVFRRLPSGLIILESANEKYPPIEVTLECECFRVIGKYRFKFSVEQ